MTVLEQDGPKVSSVDDHPFVPRKQWWTTCKHLVSRPRDHGVGHLSRCGLAEAAHLETTLTREATR